MVIIFVIYRGAEREGGGRQFGPGPQPKGAPDFGANIKLSKAP